MASAKPTKKRGAKASRLSFRVHAKKPAKKAKAKAKAKKAAKKAAKRAAKTAAKTASPKRRATKPSLPLVSAVRPQDVVLGEITAPSGTLAIFDIGLVGYLPREALEPAIVTCAVPRDRALAVHGRRVGRGRFADCWDHVAITLGAGDITHAKKLGKAGVDFARLVCMDHAALDHWQHEDSLDGLADVVFWGRDAALLAKVMNAPRTTEGHGWVDLPIAVAESKADAIARKKAENKWLLATDFRPHSHHYHALAAARRSPDGAGTLELAGTRLMLLFTSWGDGVFPIFLDLDHDDQPVQVRIQLATAEANAAMAAVNP
jgi:hypothetical protein